MECTVEVCRYILIKSTNKLVKKINKLKNKLVKKNTSDVNLFLKQIYKSFRMKIPWCILNKPV